MSNQDVKLKLTFICSSLFAFLSFHEEWFYILRRFCLTNWLFHGLGKTDNIRAYGKNLPSLLVRMFLSIIPSSPDIYTLRVKSNERLVLSRMSNVELRCTLFTQTYTKLLQCFYCWLTSAVFVTEFIQIFPQFWLLLLFYSPW